MNLIEAFALGMDRDVHELLPFPSNFPILNLGAGKKKIKGIVNLDADSGWLAPYLQYDNNSVGGVIAFHFMEHLPGREAIIMLQELQRVLLPEIGSAIFVTPHWSSEIAHQDLDHKSFWGETTWKNLFDNPYYDGTVPRNWQFRVHTCIIMGLVQRNLVTVTQIVKEQK